MDGATESLIDATLGLVLGDPIRLILAADLLVAGWVIVKLWSKLQEARTREATLHRELVEKISALERRAWELLTDTISKRRANPGDAE